MWDYNNNPFFNAILDRPSRTKEEIKICAKYYFLYTVLYFSIIASVFFVSIIISDRFVEMNFGTKIQISAITIGFDFLFLIVWFFTYKIFIFNKYFDKTWLYIP